jgi:hypothetical protein
MRLCQQVHVLCCTHTAQVVANHWRPTLQSESVTIKEACVPDASHSTSPAAKKLILWYFVLPSIHGMPHLHLGLCKHCCSIELRAPSSRAQACQLHFGYSAGQRFHSHRVIQYCSLWGRALVVGGLQNSPDTALTTHRRARCGCTKWHSQTRLQAAGVSLLAFWSRFVMTCAQTQKGGGMLQSKFLETPYFTL